MITSRPRAVGKDHNAGLFCSRRLSGYHRPEHVQAPSRRVARPRWRLRTLACDRLSAEPHCSGCRAGAGWRHTPASSPSYAAVVSVMAEDSGSMASARICMARSSSGRERRARAAVSGHNPGLAA